MALIYTGRLFHTRLHPVRHHFTYPCVMLNMGIDEPAALDKNCWSFGHNRLRLCSLFDRDYLGAASGPLREKLTHHLNQAGLSNVHFPVITLLTTPRVLGLGFNPLSLYCCFTADKALHSVVAEVHNTYGEARVYVLSDKERQQSARSTRFRFPKTLFVSPFNGVEGEYDLQIASVNDRLSVRLDLWVKDQLLIQTGFTLKGTPLTSRGLLTTTLRYPLTAIMAMSRIAHQALILRFIKKLRPRMKPNMRDIYPPPLSSSAGKRETGLSSGKSGENAESRHKNG